MDTVTSNEVPDSSTGPFVLNFTNVGNGRPVLGAAMKVALQWDPAATNWAVEWATSVTSTVWTVVTNVPADMDGSSTVLMETDGAGKVFRMRRIP